MQKHILWGLFSLLVLFSDLSLAQSSEKESPGKLIWLPIAYYTPETSFAGGLLVIKNFWKEKEGHVSHLMGMAAVTVRHQTLFSLSPRLYFAQGEWELGGNLFYDYFPSKYYGRDASHPLSSPEAYTENDLKLSLFVGKNLFSSLFLRGGGGQDLRRILNLAPGGLLQSEAQSFGSRLQVLFAHWGLEWDQRDYPQAPRQGAWYRFTQNFYQAKGSDEASALRRFQKMDLDLRQYVLLAPRWVLATQAVASEVQGEQVPFQYLNTLGGGSRLRGYYAGQYRDRALGLLQMEVRFEKNEKWTPAVFWGAGRMASSLRELNFAKDVFSGGFGVHYNLDPENRTKARIDLGFTGKETGFYFLLGEAF